MHRRNNIAFDTSGVTAGTPSTTVVSRNTTFPTPLRLGQIFIQKDVVGRGDIIWMYVEFSDATKDWLEIASAG